MLLIPQKILHHECNTILIRITVAYVYFLFPIVIHKSHVTCKKFYLANLQKLFSQVSKVSCNNHMRVFSLT